MYQLLVKKEIAQSRYNICKQCDKFNSTLKLCTQCNCLALAKVRLTFTECPLKKWTGVDDSLTEPTPYNIEKEIK